jgi:hypothetical protein
MLLGPAILLWTASMGRLSFSSFGRPEGQGGSQISHTSDNTTEEGWLGLHRDYLGTAAVTAKPARSSGRHRKAG